MKTYIVPGGEITIRENGGTTWVGEFAHNIMYALQSVERKHGKTSTYDELVEIFDETL